MSQAIWLFDQLKNGNFESIANDPEKMAQFKFMAETQVSKGYELIFVYQELSTEDSEIMDQIIRGFFRKTHKISKMSRLSPELYVLVGVRTDDLDSFSLERSKTVSASEAIIPVDNNSDGSATDTENSSVSRSLLIGKHMDSGIVSASASVEHHIRNSSGDNSGNGNVELGRPIIRINSTETSADGRSLSYSVDSSFGTQLARTVTNESLEPDILGKTHKLFLQYMFIMDDEEMRYCIRQDESKEFLVYDETFDIHNIEEWDYEDCFYSDGLVLYYSLVPTKSILWSLAEPSRSKSRNSTNSSSELQFYHTRSSSNNTLMLQRTITSNKTITQPKSMVDGYYDSEEDAPESVSSGELDLSKFQTVRSNVSKKKKQSMKVKLKQKWKEEPGCTLM